MSYKEKYQGGGNVRVFSPSILPKMTPIAYTPINATPVLPLDNPMDRRGVLNRRDRDRAARDRLKKALSAQSDEIFGIDIHNPNQARRLQEIAADYGIEAGELPNMDNPAAVEEWEKNRRLAAADPRFKQLVTEIDIAEKLYTKAFNDSKVDQEKYGEIYNSYRSYDGDGPFDVTQLQRSSYLLPEEADTDYDLATKLRITANSINENLSDDEKRAALDSYLETIKIQNKEALTAQGYLDESGEWTIDSEGVSAKDKLIGMAMPYTNTPTATDEISNMFGNSLTGKKAQLRYKRALARNPNLTEDEKMQLAIDILDSLEEEKNQDMYKQYGFANTAVERSAFHNDFYPWLRDFERLNGRPPTDEEIDIKRHQSLKKAYAPKTDKTEIFDNTTVGRNADRLALQVLNEMPGGRELYDLIDKDTATEMQTVYSGQISRLRDPIIAAKRYKKWVREELVPTLKKKLGSSDKGSVSPPDEEDSRVADNTSNATGTEVTPMLPGQVPENQTIEYPQFPPDRQPKSFEDDTEYPTGIVSLSSQLECADNDSELCDMADSVYISIKSSADGLNITPDMAGVIANIPSEFNSPELVITSAYSPDRKNPNSQHISGNAMDIRVAGDAWGSKKGREFAHWLTTEEGAQWAEANKVTIIYEVPPGYGSSYSVRLSAYEGAEPITIQPGKDYGALKVRLATSPDFTEEHIHIRPNTKAKTWSERFKNK